MKRTILLLFCLVCALPPGALASSPLSSAEKYQYVIITNNSLYASFLRLANYCNSREGLSTTVYTVEQIEGVFPGQNLRVKVRNFIKDAYATWGVRYVLLAGDTEIIPGFYMLGYSKNHGNMQILTDMYYAGLNGDWRVITRGGAQSQQVDMYPEICLGRAPVNTVAEADNFVDKTIRYKDMVTDSKAEMLMVGESILSEYGRSGLADLALNHAAAVLSSHNADLTISKLYDVVLGRGIVGWDKSVLRNGGTVPSDRRYVNGVNSYGYRLLLHFGHGDRSRIMRQEKNDIPLFTNNTPFIVYSLACYSGAFDGWDSGWAADRDCAGEKLLTSPYGAVAVIGNSRNGLGETTQVQSGPTIDLMYSFVSNIDGKRRLGEIIRQAKVSYYATHPHNQGDWEWALAEVNLLGDPTLYVYKNP